MNRSFLFAICLSVLLLSACGNKESETAINSDASAVRSADGKFLDTIDDAVIPKTASATKKLTLIANEVMVQDDGLRDVFVASGSSDTKKEIIERLTAPSDPAQKEKLSLKQATVSVWGGQVIVRDAASLLPYVKGHNMHITSSGDDLVLRSALKKLDEPYSYLLFDTSLPQHYSLENNQDWFGNAAYMIPQKEYSLLKFTRWSESSAWYIQFASGDATTMVASVYEDRSTLFGKSYDDPIIPAAIPLQLFPGRLSSWSLIYHLDLGGKSWSLPAVLKQSLENSAPLSRAHLEQYLATTTMGVVSSDMLTMNASGFVSFTTSAAKEQAILIVEASQTFLIPIHNYPFTVELNKEAWDEYQPYLSRFLTSSLLDETVVIQQLQKLFGEKNVTYNSWDKSFSYQIQPKKDYKATLRLQSIFWQTVELPMSYMIDAIKPQAVKQEILANATISILPKSGSFKDVLVQYMNISWFSLDIQSCAIATKPDILSAYQWYGLENYLFNCSGSWETVVVRPDPSETFVYRKAYRTAVKIPASLADSSAFRVSFTDQQKKLQVHYFLKSDLGIRAKIADSNLHVRWFTLDDGKPLQDAVVKVTTLWGKQIAEESLQSSKAVIALPEPSGKDYQEAWRDDVYLVEIIKGSDRSVVLVHRSGAESVTVPASSPEGDNRYLKINSRLTANEVMSSNGQQINEWWYDESVKIYGYSDRSLYKAWETIHMAWFVRDVRVFDSLEYLKKARVSVSIVTPTGEEVFASSWIVLDKFGGFTVDYSLAQSVPLGDYVVNYSVMLGDKIMNYSHNIKVEEYQKPTFFVDVTHASDMQWTKLVIAPQYYFWEALKSYDVKVTRSLVGKDVCAYCRWRNSDPWYFNHVFNDTIATGGSFTLYNQTSSASQRLYGPDLQINKGYTYTLKAEIILKDRVSDETQFITKYIDFKPAVKLGLSGQPSEYLYADWVSDPRKDYRIEGTVTAWKEQIATLRYEVYFWSYDQTMQQGVDGNLYFLNGQWYALLTSGTITKPDAFAIPTNFLDKPGEYFVRVIATNEQEQTVAEVQKMIQRYKTTDDNNGLLWSLPNNYSLKVDIPKKTYAVGDAIPVNIAPYQAWARVVVTVERGQNIVDSFLMQLDGKVISIPVKQWYAPNIIVSVMQLVGTQKSSSLRQEPRFYAGYAEAQIDTAIQTMQVDVSTDKTKYLPWETVRLSLSTKDSTWKAVDARVSLAVIDAALLSLYDTIKEPIPYFFNKLGTSVFSYSNMKLLYQSLKAFATAGSKGWGGDGGKAMFSYIRDDLQDAAFRSGAIYTKDGKAELSFVLPENVTTWTIDALGISVDTKLWTTRKDIVVSKDFIVETNSPLYVTIGDTLQIPVKMIVAKWSLQGDTAVKGSASLTNAFGKTVSLWAFQALPNKKSALSITIPHDRWNSPYVTLRVEASYAGMKDGTSVIIPLRADGLVMRDSVGVINTKGNHSFSTPVIITGSLTMRLNQLPTNYIDPVAQYLIRYPYGCTEQLLSSLLPLMTLQELIETKKFSSALLSGDTVLTDHGPVNRVTALQDGIAKLLSHQRSDGSFGYRPSETDLTPSIHHYMLSAYVYGSLQRLKKTAIMTKQIDTALSALENYLWTYRTLSQEASLWYFYQKASTNGTLSEAEQLEVNKVKLNAEGYIPVLRYLIAVATKDVQASKERRLLANIPSNDDGWNAYSIFLNPTVVTALKLETSLQDPDATQVERMELLQSLLSLREKNGLRGWSTQANAQVLHTLAILAQYWTPKKTLTCSLDYAGKQESIQVSPDGVEKVVALSTTGVTVKRDCDGLLLADMLVTYLPKQLEDVLGTENHVSNMQWSISDPKASIGEAVDIFWSFSAALAGEQVAVELFVPSDYKLLDVISSKNKTNDSNGYAPVSLPFTVSDQSCIPSHRETRFDRLFLYYDNLPVTTCDISISALKAYSGSTTVMPFRVYEMYRGKVNGRKVILNE